jgi:hypothetical protein
VNEIDPEPDKTVSPGKRREEEMELNGPGIDI